MRLIVDDRERAVVPWLPPGSFACQRLTVGDYAVLNGDEICAVIERKTLEDYAASFKDGRHQNKEKMLEVGRATPTCTVFYIVEGPMWPPEGRFFGGIPFKHIQASIDHLAVRDNIHVIYTRDAQATAARLLTLVANMSTLRPPKAGGDEPQIPVILTKKKAVSKDDTCRAMWGAFSGISSENCDQYASKWAIRDVVLGVIPRSEIHAPRRAQASLSAVDKSTEVRLLSRVPGVSAKRAGAILSAYSLRQLLESPCEVTALIVVGDRAIGPKLASGIHDAFGHVINQFHPP
jgi:ERCC4-type nuclease